LNPRKSIKGSKDLDSSLVSNKNLNEILPSSGLAPGPGNLSQNGQKPTPTYGINHKKTQNQKIFFSV